MGAKLVCENIPNGKSIALKPISVSYVKLHGFHDNPLHFYPMDRCANYRIFMVINENMRNKRKIIKNWLYLYNYLHLLLTFPDYQPWFQLNAKT